MKKDFPPENELLFLALGGSGEIGMNVYAYGLGDEALGGR